MNNQNIFAAQFTSARPFSVAQYVNEMFRLSASMSSNASPDDFRILEAIAINVKIAHEYKVQTSLVAALHQIEELKAENNKLKTGLSDEQSVKELTEQLQLMDAEMQKKDLDLFECKKYFNQRLDEQHRYFVNKLNHKCAENQELRRRCANAVENKAKDEDAKVAQEVARQVAEEVTRQTQEKDWKIARLKYQIKEFSHKTNEHIKVVNLIYKKNQEIEELRGTVDRLTDWKDAYHRKCMERKGCHPKFFDPAELVSEIDKLVTLNTILKCRNEEYREEIRGYECLHGMMDKNWAEVKQENDDLKKKLKELELLFVEATANYNILSKRSHSLNSLKSARPSI